MKSMNEALLDATLEAYGMRYPGSTVELKRQRLYCYLGGMPYRR